MRERPFLPTGYQFEAPDFLPVVLSEVDFQYGDPIRAVRTSETPISLSDLVSTLTSRAGRAVILLGEAGIGKTTLCRLLCRLLADGTIGESLLPIYLPLGGWDPKSQTIDILADKELGFSTLYALLTEQSFAKKRLIVFLDGLNEQDPENLKTVLSFARRLVVSHRATVVLTTRPVAAADRILPVEDVRFFEIKRWTAQQLASYFTKNHRAEMFRQIPLNVRNSLRLPLLAFLVLRRMLYENRPPLLRAISDVFAYVLGQFTQEISILSKARAIRGPAKIDDRLVVTSLGELALRMTQQHVVQTTGRTLEDCLAGGSKKAFKVLIAHSVNGGLLRCSNSIVAVDPDSSAEELREVRFGFLHQSLQEYLTALRLQELHSADLPTDISHDAFWREIPIYMTRSLSNSPNEQMTFVLGFLRGGNPDFLTVARLINEIALRSNRSDVQQRVVTGLVTGVEAISPYPYSVEAFRELGTLGLATLRKCIGDRQALKNVYAEAEAHVIGLPIDKALETLWRRAGRSIYMLGELGDTDFLKDLVPHIPDIQSVHLLYHIAEALLTLTKHHLPTGTLRKTVREISLLLRDHPLADPVLKAQAFAVEGLLASGNSRRSRPTNEVVDFLRARASDSNPHFKEEFWRRAHGVEALAEIAGTDTCVSVLREVFAIEDKADYLDYKDGDYHQVQSSILKAIARCCDSHPGKRSLWKELLEAVFRSARIADNKWACIHLESLLVRSYSDAASLRWINEWKDSGTLGGESIERVLANVLWLAN